MSRRSGPWSVLGLDRTGDVRAIRRAYADKLKAMDIDREAAQYAALRDARDMALRWAKSRPDDAGREQQDEWSISGFPPEDDGELAVLDAGYSGEEGDAAFDLPEQPAILSEEEQAKLPDRRLDRLLFPNGEASEAPFTPDEQAEALAAIRELIADMLAGDLARQRMGDFWIADRLASAWPRSAPLLEEAAAAFEWEKERGQLGEGAAQAFLNARLRGLRFYDAVQQPDHWAFKEWKELSAPGEKGMFGRFRANKYNVERLLAGIRENFPEVESYLDPGKVASWDRTLGNPWKISSGLFFAIFLGFQLLRFCSSAVSDSGDSFELPVIESTVEHWTAEDRDRMVVELFGRGATFDAVQAAAPFLAASIRLRTPLDGVKGGDEIALRELVRTVRQATFMVANDASFENLVRIKQLKLELAGIAQDDGGTQACVAMLESARLFDSVTVPDEVREKEREVARSLLDAGAFAKEPAAMPETTAQIPGEIFAAAERRSGISGEAAKQAAMGKGDDLARCAFRRALMGEVLRQPGRVSAELLKVL